jgi:hypothetical protein
MAKDEQITIAPPPSVAEDIRQQVAQRQWERKQRRITDVSTGLTAAGAAGLGALLAGKTKAAGKVLPKALHHKLQSGKADDVRNAVALASMVAGVASGVHWSKKLKEDSEKPVIVKADNLARVIPVDLEKGIRVSGLARIPGGGYAFRNATSVRPRRFGVIRARRFRF